MHCVQTASNLGCTYTVKHDFNSTTLLSTGISDEDIAGVTLPTGIPVLLELDENLRPVKPRQLLGDQAKIQAAIKKVEDQGKAKPST